jgi:hypothetical protein
MKKIIFVLLISITVYALFFSEKARLDREVNRLCAIDGGIKVYETVKLPAEKFDQHGRIRIPYKEIVKSEDEYYYESSRHYLIKGSPEMWRSNYRIYRNLDKKLLGEAIVYIRRGGDIPGPWHESSFMCPENEVFNYLIEKTFSKI